MKEYKYILIDWDGTIVNTLSLWLDAYHKVFAEFGLQPTDKEIIQSAYGNWEGSKKLGITDANYNEFNQKLQEFVNLNFPNCKLHQNVTHFLERMKRQGKKICLVTTSTRETITVIIKNKKIESLFDAWVTAEDVHRHKPDPEPLLKAIELLGGNTREAIMIGDMEKDIEAANRAKVDSALFYPDLHAKLLSLEMLMAYQPTYLVKDLKELENIIR